jgi:hypothetical protein
VAEKIILLREFMEIFWHERIALQDRDLGLRWQSAATTPLSAIRARDRCRGSSVVRKRRRRWRSAGALHDDFGGATVMREQS